jgi:hypothetical protein
MLSVHKLRHDEISKSTHSAFRRDKNRFHPIEHVDWNGNLY